MSKMEIDVSKCEYFDTDSLCDCSLLGCECMPQNCYYKQLQQAIKDRDYYKQIVDGCKSENGNCSFCEIDKQLQQLKQGNEQLKQENEYLKKCAETISTIKLLNHYEAKIDKITLDYEQELKQLQDRCNKIEQENEYLRSDNSMLLAQGDANAFVVSNLNFKIQKLQQCLDEIEEICNKYYKSEDELLKIRNKKWLYAFSKGVITGENNVANEVLQLIKQAKEGK